MFAARFNFPRFKGIYDARLHHDNITPIRGTDVRPIGSRRRKDVNIRVENGNVALRFYDTDVVTFLPDGTINVELGGWVTQSTRNFIYTALAGCFIAHNRMWIHTTKGWQALRPHETNTFRRAESGNLEFLNPLELRTHTVNRAGANNVRKRFKPFKSYVNGMFKLFDPEGKKVSVPNITLYEVFGNFPEMLRIRRNSSSTVELVNKFLELAESTETTDHYKAWVWLVYSAGYPVFQRKEYFCHKTATLKQLDDLILYANRGECFNEVDAPIGEAVRDPYIKFFG